MVGVWSMLLTLLLGLTVVCAWSFRPLSSSSAPPLSTTRWLNSQRLAAQDPALEGIVNGGLEQKRGHRGEKVFCNVELNLGSLEAVGFDMDFTLAQYNEAFDLLAFDGAKRKLVEHFGYPPEILDFQFNPEQFRRGLIIDKKRGNVLKVDRHKYVRKAYHGLDELPTATRKAIYRKQVASFTESHYVNIDTMFLIVDAALFTNLVDFRDRNLDKIPKTYEQLFADVRHSVDLCHRDGTIKSTVMNNPGSPLRRLQAWVTHLIQKYIIYDSALVPMLKQLRGSNKKLFLLTNSMWEYTEVVMKYLVESRREHGDLRWQDLFDLIIVGACKPAFLRNDYLSIFKVDTQGHLHNMEDKDSWTWPRLAEHKTFQGGCWQDLHRMLDITFGDRILYVGDHMYADILRSKRTLGWRTCLIIPELEHELQIAQRETELAKQIYRMRKLQFDLDEFVDELRTQAQADPSMKDKLGDAEGKADLLKKSLQQTSESYNRKFNKCWGQLFKAGHQDSRFAKQVMDYACLYTSKVSNLGNISPHRSFRPLQDFMPHDQFMFQSSVSDE